MRIEIIRADGDLKREVWTFNLSIDYARPCIYFEEYSFQTRETTRYKKWITHTHWERLDRRLNNVDNPVLPPDVEAEMRFRYQKGIMTLPIVK